MDTSIFQLLTDKKEIYSFSPNQQFEVLSEKVFFENSCVRTVVIEFAAYCIAQVVHLTPVAIQSSEVVDNSSQMHTSPAMSISTSSSPVIYQFPNEMCNDCDAVRNLISPDSIVHNSTSLQPFANPSTVSVDIVETQMEIANKLAIDEAENHSEELKTQREVATFICGIRYHAGLVTSELLVALSLIDSLSRRHWQHGRFALNKENVFLVVLVTVMIAHKCSCDKPYLNGWWSRTFRAPLRMINEMERLILHLLTYDVNVSPHTYERYYSALVDGCVRCIHKSVISLDLELCRVSLPFYQHSMQLQDYHQSNINPELPVDHRQDQFLNQQCELSEMQGPSRLEIEQPGVVGEANSIYSDESNLAMQNQSLITQIQEILCYEAASNSS
ncbi:uncharacterized protein MONOS_2449 [Monocercomonoides exilis]|uniref:uncharacterized protein n=1 Tax=Monocercomonoides exilis TaxID=2049356 RepID=UPI00355A1C12|nr:hypothetical protein MONOS_2449 [Monocercomonoides exilis]|eukprot:MONOS_2449.1-p1 / transcript=MONOS_2449.1 / gene=MONOS_2449 / organism=Monocercomonoides_exilis_PA203 / gene_product=unspecified product / transcript_product=unspecified product / location=Mono_scaffold00050:171801-173110(+) / protein_length=386 / sequence_SO=supercontig / SO=protein_coding / is_pseudo=false